MPSWGQEGPAVQQQAANSPKPTQAWGLHPPTHLPHPIWWGLHPDVPGVSPGNLRPLKRVLFPGTGITQPHRDEGNATPPTLWVAGCHPATEPWGAWGAPFTFPGVLRRTQRLSHRCCFCTVMTLGSIRFRCSSLFFPAGTSLAGQRLLMVGVVRCALHIWLNFFFYFFFYLRKYQSVKTEHAGRLILTLSIYSKLPEYFDLL